jgi:putative redox protein
MKCRINWVEGKQFVAESESGHALVLDAPESFGGNNTGPTPMELMLLGTAGCTAVDVVYILGERMHTDVRALEVTAEADRAETEPKVFTAVRLHYRLEGSGVKQKNVERALSLSLDKYCSASAMIAHTARVTATWECLDHATGDTLRGELAAHSGND